jgi:hypothetical protein
VTGLPVEPDDYWHRLQLFCRADDVVVMSHAAIGQFLEVLALDDGAVRARVVPGR